MMNWSLGLAQCTMSSRDTAWHSLRRLHRGCVALLAAASSPSLPDGFSELLHAVSAGGRARIHLGGRSLNHEVRILRDYGLSKIPLLRNFVTV